MTNYPMEHNLNMPMADLLTLIHNRIVTESTYFGIKSLKNPLDHWVYQELICERRPDYIVEIGNYTGASTLALAHICDHLKKGHVIGVDINHQNLHPLAQQHPRISFLRGEATQLFSEVRAMIPEDVEVLVIEDSSHTYDNTLAVLNTYQSLVKPGGYFIVEDSICHHGISIGPNPGPYEAIEAFIQHNPHFVIDRNRESFTLTWNPRGYLKRVS